MMLDDIIVGGCPFNIQYENGTEEINITKPFSPREVVFRIKAQLRRLDYNEKNETKVIEKEKICAGRMYLKRSYYRYFK